jgi:hypothetical protein
MRIEFVKRALLANAWNGNHTLATLLRSVPLSLRLQLTEQQISRTCIGKVLVGHGEPVAGMSGVLSLLADLAQFSHAPLIHVKTI